MAGMSGKRYSVDKLHGTDPNTYLNVSLGAVQMPNLAEGTKLDQGNHTAPLSCRRGPVSVNWELGLASLELESRA